jgi:hypothetical protein
MAAKKIERWDTTEYELKAVSVYANPFRDVHLAARFTHRRTGRAITVDGFHDGGSTDRGLGGKTGSLECVAPKKAYLHGPLRAVGHAFRHVDGTSRFLITTRLSCQFGPPSTWPALVRFVKQGGINRVLFMMVGVSSDKDAKHGPPRLFGPGKDFSRYAVERFRAIDAFIDTLRKADILASPYFYYDPGRELLWTMTPEEDRAYIRYGMARLGAYANVMPVLANETELKTTNYKDAAFDMRAHEWVNEMGSWLKSRAVFGQPVSVHNPCWHEYAVNPSFFSLLKDWPFAKWTDFMLKQVQMGSVGTALELSDSVPQPKLPTFNERAYARRNQLLIDLHRFGQPVIDEEPGYDYSGTESSWNAQTPETLRKTFWSGAVAGAYAVWGSIETYQTVDPLPLIKDSLTPKYLRVLQDLMSELPFEEMAPDNGIVSPNEVILDGKTWRSNFGMGKSGEVYLVYSLRGVATTVTLPPGRYRATRIDPRSGERTRLGDVKGGAMEFILPPGEDWALLFVKAREPSPKRRVKHTRHAAARRDQRRK